MNLGEFFLVPELLPLMLLVPAAVFVRSRIDRARTRRLEALVGPRHSFLADVSSGQRRVRRRLGAMALLLVVLALLQPTWGEGVRRIEQRGVDLLICLDVSRSMLARDVEPSRLMRARQEIRALAERARGDRLGLVVFAGEARLTVPMTQDVDSFLHLLDLAEPFSVKRGGTDLGAALELALATFEGSSGSHEAVVLITDGEDLERRGLRVAEECAKRNITVHCAGLGSTRGSKIAVAAGGVATAGRGAESFLRDAAGADVISTMDPASLRRIAERTGGEFINAGRRAGALVDLYDDRIVPMARKAFAAEDREERQNRFQWPLLLALAFWLLELGIGDRRWRRGR